MAEILLIDDSECMLRAARNQLVAGGHSVTTLTRGAEALKLLGRGPFDLVISDYNMPEMSGLELLRHIRAADITVPFILYSGAGGPEVGHTCKKYKAEFFLKGTRSLLDKVTETLVD